MWLVTNQIVEQTKAVFATVTRQSLHRIKQPIFKTQQNQISFFLKNYSYFWEKLHLLER